ncbi:autotransporter outer membrane beta-barrel domain-containing protein [Terasakiella sp. SH-1]|uniref:autotransporter outer membrane beta-barrel domain-containing protein n=1 Tax=Terasakiella sp. SH-1 TaxID=2560057 RepID=UPI0010746641|nr:autotransporter outer membrane beta-barrel domain-containing protein [Terasakiella sp. SH-1]
MQAFTQFRYFKTLSLGAGLFISALWTGQAQAAVITCTGTASETTSNASGVTFDPATDQCVVTDGLFADSTNWNTNSIFFRAATGANDESFNQKISNSYNKTTYSGTCTIGSFSISDGTDCADNRTTNGSETASASYLINGETYTMNVSYTISSNGNDIDITSATVSYGVSAASSVTNTHANKAVQSAVSRSVSKVVTENVQTRLSYAAATSAPAVNIPSGGAPSGSTPSGGAPTGTPGTQEQASSFAPMFSLSSSVQDWDNMEFSSRKGSLRDLAMMAHFDSSQMVLSAAGDDNDPLQGTKQRQALGALSNYTVWGHGSYTSVENERNRTNDDSRYDGDVWGYNIGVDYRYRPNLVAGLSLGYTKTDLTTTYNSGTYDEKGWTLSPYAMYQPTPETTLSMVAGYTIGDIDRTRGTVTGKTDSKMWFASLSGAYKARPNKALPLDLTAKASFLAAHKTVDAFVESDNTDVAKSISNTRQFKPGVEAAYTFDIEGKAIQPYAKADYIYDATDATNGDSGAYNIGGGVRIASSATGLSGSLEGEKQYGRSDYSEHSFSGLIAYSFTVDHNDGQQAGIAEPYIKTNFTNDAQTFATGVKFTDDANALSASFDVTQTASEIGENSPEFNLNLQLQF